MQKAAHAYLQTNVTTTSPGEVVIMLYDGAIRFLNRAKDGMEAKDYAAKGIAISKATDIIAELDAVLNREKGGDLAENLHKLYFWCISKLSWANLKMDKDLVDTVIKVLAGLKSAFEQIQSSPEAQAAAAQLADRQQAFIQTQARNMSAAGAGHEELMPSASLRGHSAYKMAQGGS